MAINNYKQDEAKTKFSWRNIKRIVKFFAPYKKELLLSCFLGIASGILMLFIPKVLAYAVDVSFVNKNFLEIVFLSFVILILVFLSTFLTKIRRNKLLVALDKTCIDLKNALFTKLQYLPNSYFDTHSHGKIYTRATSYPDDATAIICYVLLDTILDLINLVFVIIFMLTTNVILSLASIILSIVILVFLIAIAPLRRKIRHNLNDKSSNVNGFISESLSGIRITQSFNREEVNTNILNNLETSRRKAASKSYYMGNLNWTLTGAADIISWIFIYFVGLKYMYPAVSLGSIISIASYSSNFWGPIEYMTSSINDLMDAITYLERMFELLDEPLLIEDMPNAKNININGQIEFKDVSFSYDGKTTVLDKINLEIKPGQKIGLVGATGCGKSTILNLINRMYDINDGEILIDNHDIKEFKLSSLRSQINMMLQDNFLFAKSVYDNLVLDKNISLKKVKEICQMLDIHNTIMKLEKGYDTVLLNDGSNLSSGEKQLLCLARIMIQNPKILILDEATSNVDLKTEKKIEKAIKIVTEGRTTIMVAHRISTIKNCDKIFLIKNHQVAEEGNHNTLMKKKKEYYKLYTSQSL